MSHLLINGMALLMSLLFPQNVLRIQSHSSCNPSAAFIQAENNFAGSTNVVSQPFDSDNTQGCLIVDAAVGYGVTVDSVSVEDSNGNGQATSPFNPSYLKYTNSLNTSVASLSYASNIKTGANTVSAVAVGSALTAGMQEVIVQFSGATTPDQQANSTCTSCSNPIVTPSITIGQTELVVSYLYDSTVHTYTDPAGWTICAKCFNTVTTSSYIAYRVLAAGTYSVSWTGFGSISSSNLFHCEFQVRFVMKRLLAMIPFLFLAACSYAQSTTVSGTVTDANGQAFANGTYRIEFDPNGVAPPYQWNGSPFTPGSHIFTGNLNSSGAFSGVSVPSNTSIAPNTQWKFTVCPQATAPCYTKSILITGASQSVTANLTPPAILVPSNTYNQPTAYSDSEIGSPVIGFTYFNLTDQLNHTCTVAIPCTWVTGGGGGGSGTVTDVSGTSPIAVATGTTTPVVSCPTCNTSSATVTSVSCVTGCSVANPTTTPAITVTGGSGTVTNVSGTYPISTTSPTTTPVVACAGCSVLPVGVDSGAANALTFTTTPTLGSLVPGSSFYGQVAHNNTSTTTINVNGGGAVPLYALSGQASGGEMVTGTNYQFFYDGHNWRLAGAYAPGVAANPGGTINLSGAYFIESPTTGDKQTLGGLTFITGAGTGITDDRQMMNFICLNADGSYCKTTSLGIDHDGFFLLSGDGAFADELPTDFFAANLIQNLGTGDSLTIEQGNTPVAGAQAIRVNAPLSTTFLLGVNATDGLLSVSNKGIQTATASNTELAGVMVASGGTATYTFLETHTTAPVCIVQDDTTIASLLTKTVSTTTLTVTTTGASDHVSYICVGLN